MRKKPITNPEDIENALKLIRGNSVECDVGTNYLLAKFTPMIHKLIYQVCPTCDKSDMVQAGHLGILMAISTYKDNGRNQFSSWAYSKIRNELQQQRAIEFPVKVSRYLLKKGCLASFEQMDDNILYEKSPHDALIDKELSEEVADALRHINRRFPKLHCKLFTDYYFIGVSLTSLSKKYKLNANSIVRAMILDIRDYTKRRI